ncbi:LysR family transcriptional regulator [Tritonibacter horizontis]|uniref:Glycine cleavage system transcriptional activator n=1 Tax=Tritonibacter horizontis TaxID=1768241 RepID=A0A132C3N1_9RHOB|nr:LysR family transcriptional regulator [Tritonibacter horizontis]KUP94680.1 glycine cleavage system transcriptional activator [Tritonibacter horizontis]
MNELPPLNSLRAFDAAGRRLSFRAAADELGVTQGAVAQQVRQLEAHLGFPLFERVPKGLVLTSVGRSFHNRIADVFADLRSSVAELKPEPNKVLISVTPTFAAKWLIPNLPDFTATHPNIDLRIMATEKLSSFHSDGIDLAVRQGSPPFGASLDVTLLFKQTLIAVASPKFAAKGGDPIDLDALAKLPKIHDAHDLWPGYLAYLGALLHRSLIARNAPNPRRISGAAFKNRAAKSGHSVKNVDANFSLSFLVFEASSL